MSLASRGITIMDIMTDVLVMNWIELSLMGGVNGWVCISNYAGNLWVCNPQSSLYSPIIRNSSLAYIALLAHLPSRTSLTLKCQR